MFPLPQLIVLSAQRVRFIALLNSMRIVMLSTGPLSGAIIESEPAFGEFFPAPKSASFVPPTPANSVVQPDSKQYAIALDLFT